MSDKSAIEWTEATWNPVTGCSKVSQGCKHCYAERDWARLSANPATRYHGRAFTDVQCHADVLDLPLRWKRPRRIFVNSMSDLFHEAVPDEFIQQVFMFMGMASQHSFQVLTKRPERMRALLNGDEIKEFVVGCWGNEGPELEWPLPNVWLGVSVEDQATADERILLLLQTPAAVRWISAEPLLGPVDLTRLYGGICIGGSVDLCIDALTAQYGAAWKGRQTIPERPLSALGCAGIDWVVAGGESGPHARPMHPAWARSLRDQCAAAGVPFLFKQWGEYVPFDLRPGLWPVAVPRWTFGDGQDMERIGKKTAGRLLDGMLHDEYPGRPA